MDGMSWHGGDPRCPRWDALAYVVVDHVTFEGGAARGEQRWPAALAPRAVELFRRLWRLGFPIRQLRLVDDFGASDDASMAADNSSAFNFRVIAGTDTLSQTRSAARSTSTPSRTRSDARTGSIPRPAARSPTGATSGPA